MNKLSGLKEERYDSWEVKGLQQYLVNQVGRWLRGFGEQSTLEPLKENK